MNLYYYSTLGKASTIMITLPSGTVIIGDETARQFFHTKQNISLEDLPLGSMIHRIGVTQ